MIENCTARIDNPGQMIRRNHLKWKKIRNSTADLGFFQQVRKNRNGNKYMQK